MGLSGHEGHGEVPRGRQVLHPREPPDHRADQDHRQEQRRCLLGGAEGAAGQEVRQRHPLFLLSPWRGEEEEEIGLGLRIGPRLSGVPGPVTPPLLELVSVSKTYPGVKALDRVSLRVERGEVLALIGENGAGKSTLMKILGGAVEPSEGGIRIDGAAHGSLTVAGAMAAGIAFVHQELNLFDNLDVAANVMIGREPVFGGPLKLIDRTALEAKVTPLL